MIRLSLTRQSISNERVVELALPLDRGRCLRPVGQRKIRKFPGLLGVSGALVSRKGAGRKRLELSAALRQDQVVEWDEDMRAGVDVALNEADVLGVRLRPLQPRPDNSGPVIPLDGLDAVEEFFASLSWSDSM